MLFTLFLFMQLLLAIHVTLSFVTAPILSGLSDTVSRSPEDGLSFLYNLNMLEYPVTTYHVHICNCPYALDPSCLPLNITHVEAHPAYIPNFCQGYNWNMLDSYTVNCTFSIYRWMFISKNFALIRNTECIGRMVSLICMRTSMRRMTYYYALSQLVPIYSILYSDSVWPTGKDCVYFLSQISDSILYLTCNYSFFNTISCQPPNVSISTKFDSFDNTILQGGGAPVNRIVSANLLKDNLVEYKHCAVFNDNGQYRFMQYFINTSLVHIEENNSKFIMCRFTLEQVACWLSRPDLISVARIHGIYMNKSTSREKIDEAIVDHMCDSCLRHVCIFEEIECKPDRYKKYRANSSKNIPSHDNTSSINKAQLSQMKYNTYNKTDPCISSIKFPPSPPSKSHIENIINGFCKDSDPTSLEEAGCSVCGQLCQLSTLILLTEFPHSLDILTVSGITRRERSSINDPITELEGPVLDTSCMHICPLCALSIASGKVPHNALANGLWIGNIPPQLQNLSFAERMLIARIRHNKCLVRVSAGRAKMSANVIMYSNPTVKVYQKLPPSRSELDEVLAFIFTGPAQPTDDDFKRTPMLVRRHNVLNALEWLKLNHRDYEDLEISKENLASYPLNGVPVKIDYMKRDSDNRVPSAMSVHDNEDEDGSLNGPCPFSVHGLTGANYGSLSIKALKAHALRHLESEGKMLGIGHNSVPQSMYDNPQAYPQMFPWLFPYGYGGIGQLSFKHKLSEIVHKRSLLLYHDKRFQCDLYFPIIAFNHEQLKGGVTGSFLVAKRRNFHNISSRLLSIDKDVLSNITERLTIGESVRPETNKEKACFSILDDLDHVGGYVKGSLTSKKYMRNEIWSLLAFQGAPSWFITLSPADNHHLISLYYSDTKVRFQPTIFSKSERHWLNVRNPVAAARFFHLVVELFIKHVLGFDNKEPGLYGKTSAYYGTVEQQGRLTLHLHMLIWITNALSPQDIRDRIMNGDSVFQQELVAYLEGAHKGEFITGRMQDIKEKVPFIPEEETGVHTIYRESSKQIRSDYSYEDPTLTLPITAPKPCRLHDVEQHTCNSCTANDMWWEQFNSTVDDIILRSNVHTCKISRDVPVQDTSKSSESTSNGNTPKAIKGCLDRNGICRAHFPRPTYEHTVVDNSDGHIFMKKLESMVNTFTPTLLYLTRSNTDVTSLLSGTSIKAIVSYISDYISKPALKTYQIFSSMYDVFERNNAENSEDMKPERSDSTRRLLLKIVNSLSSKMEIGSPMASMYLLGNPDHYASHKFVPFWWKSYVSDVKRYWDSNADRIRMELDNVESLDDSDEHMEADNIILGRHEGTYVGSSNVDDYKYRPSAYSNMSLYEWIQTSIRWKLTKSEIQKIRERHSFSESKDEHGNIIMSDETVALTADNNSPSRSTYMPFLDEHPLAETHVVTCKYNRVQFMVPNFVGGPLPRSDQGDRDNYCRTMLTLFKPWRSGADLKTPHQSWDDAYNMYKFSTKHTNLMKNFNLRYECLDARDDFHAELKKREVDIRRRGETEYGLDDNLEDDNSDDLLQWFTSNKEDYEAQGPTYNCEVNFKREADNLMNSTGWLNQCRDIQLRPMNRFVPTVGLPHTAWANVIKAERDKKFQQKMSGYIPPADGPVQKSQTASNEVRILSANYLLKTYKAKKAEHATIIDDTINTFSLNEEQERAFRIIANHASSMAPEPLRMYLGGMGGTGKSQVIKAVTHMFHARKESFRFIVLAPTGSAAALLNGSTYHRVLGIRSRSDKGVDYTRNEGAIINEVRTRLQGVEYIFIDEVSMISCKDLFAISERLHQVRNIDSLFGDMNMILAGDFAQLPPVGEQPLYSPNVSTKHDTSMKPHQQQATLGKIFWHQFTTVVILKQNMRQRTQTVADTKLRTALENMRYGACTADDIAFLNSRVADNLFKDNKSIFTDPRFRNISIITAWNNQKDRFNEQGAARFAADHGLELTHFYSVDSLGIQDESPSKDKKKWGRTKGRKPRKLVPQLQEALWNRSPCSSEQVAAKLSLCIGMPVMIRNNDATELCITKGQEATVAGWDSSTTPSGNKVLETLFVKLTNPPQEINIPNLPTNIVPLTRTSTRIVCTLKSGIKVTIQCQQIQVLPNFAMTDYASQGKTRAYNVVHLAHCKDHMSYYTCLSRSASADGTVLLQSPDANKISKGISGYLRQEFRELNVLDEVTRLRYEGSLPDGILHPLRNPTVRAYVQWNKSHSNEKGWHPALAYDHHEKHTKDIEDDDTWEPNTHIQIEHTHPKKRKIDTSTNEAFERDLKCVPPPIESQRAIRSPRGFLWDAENYSCAYDATFTIMHSIWTRNPDIWHRRLADISNNLDIMCAGFKHNLNNEISLEQARNAVRDHMRRTNPANHPTGSTLTAISHVIESVTPFRSCGTSTLVCESCNYHQANPLLHFGEYVALMSTGCFHDNSEQYSLVSNVLGWQLNNRQRRSNSQCPECLQRQRISKLCLNINLERLPYLMIVEFTSPRYIIDHNIHHTTIDPSESFRLAGIIYGGQNHFVCRVIDTLGTIWYHDGMITGRGCHKEYTLSDIEQDPYWLCTSNINGVVKHALYAVYTRE